MKLTGISWDAEGTPEFIVETVRQRVRELSASLPEGQTTLMLKAKLDHVRPKKPRKR